MRFMRFSVCVNQGSTLEFRTIVGADRGAKAWADAGRSCRGIATVYRTCAVLEMRCDGLWATFENDVEMKWVE